MIATPDDCSKEALAQALFSQARALVPKLRERAPRCEKDRRVPEETIEDFIASGLLRAPHPSGALDWDIVCEIVQILAGACGSQAWIYWVFVNHAQMISAFAPEAHSEVWGTTGRCQLISASLDPVGRAYPVEGGVYYSGPHKFASGIDHADWLICGGHVERQDGREGPFLFLIPKSQVTVIDDWFPLGLEGTGSKGFTVTEAFVPLHRCVRIAAPNGAVEKYPTDGPDTKTLLRGEGITSAGFASLAVGMARGVLEEWLAHTGSRQSSERTIAAQQATQIMAAQSGAEIDAAEALYLGYLRALLEKAANGERILQSERTTSQRNVAFACQLALQAGTRLFNSAGERALFNDSGLQRQYRNLLAATAHYAVVWNSAAVEYGSAVLDCDQPGATST